MPHAGTISTYESGVDVVFEWKIENFFNLPQWDGALYFSPDFKFGGEEWWLTIWPNGSSRNDSSGHMDLSLKKWPSNRSIKQSSSLSLKTARGDKCNEQHFSKDFDNVNKFHAFNRFTPRSELSNRRFELVPEDVLTVVCTMKNTTSAGSDSNIAPASAECRHCKGTFNADSLSTHQKKCMQMYAVKCPNCLEVVVLQKWFDEHECQQDRTEDLSSRSIKQSFSLSFKTTRGEKYNEEQFTLDFDNDNNFHRFNRFIPRSELSRKRSDLTPDGTLTIICTMKSSTSVRSDRDEVPTAEVNTSYVAGSSKSEASGSRQAGTTTTKESVLKWIKENCKEASKGKKRKLKEENVLKWIEENCKEASIGKKRKMEEENKDGSLSQDFKKLLLEGLNHDLILKVGGKELRAHRNVLRTRSQVFKSMLGHDMKEKNSGIIDIPDCDPLAMEQFLFYIYSGNIEKLDQSNMLNLYYIADKYEMKGLKKECNDFIRESLSQANICDVIQLALNHSDSSLLESTTVYFRNNMLGILRTVEWQVFLKENSTVANELLIKTVENLSNVKS